MALATPATSTPTPYDVGMLFFDLASAFTTGQLAEHLGVSASRSELVQDGRALQTDAATLLEQIASRLGIAIDDVPVETGGGFGRLAQAAWKWLRSSSRALASKAKQVAPAVANAAGKIAVVGGVAIGGLTFYDWVTGEEQTRRAAIAAKRDALLALIAKMPPSEVSRAFDKVSSGLDADSGRGLTWWQWGLIGAGCYAGYRFLSSSGRRS